MAIDYDNLEYQGNSVRLLHYGFDIVIIANNKTNIQYCVSCKEVGLPNRKRPNTYKPKMKQNNWFKKL